MSYYSVGEVARRAFGDEQPGKSGSTKSVQDCDTKVTSEDEDDGEELFDSDSEDEWMRFAEQLSLGAVDSDNVQTDSDDEQMRFAKQLSLMKMYSDICDTRFDDYVEDDNNTSDKQSGADNSQSMCEICTDTTDDMLSYGCSHYYCRSCVQKYLEIDINEGKIETFKCPAPECDVCVSENFVKTVVSATVYNKYETLMIRRAVGDMDDIVYCPFAECGAMIETEGSGMTQCWKCSHFLCTLCSKLYHGNTDCELTEDERTDNLRRIQDEKVAEKIFLEESQNQLLMEAIERENEEWTRRMREEHAEIRRMEQIEQEEEERRQEEAERREQIERKLEEDRRKEMEFQRLVQENEESERRRQQILNERRQAEIASEQTVKNTTKQCPKCKSPIEKNDGCIHMTCIKCKHEFCWGCMMQWAHHHLCSR